MTRVVRSVTDLDDGEIEHLLARAAQLRDGAVPARRDAIVSLMFLEPSLRTRIGFSAAAARLGARTIEVGERRRNARSVAESLGDTLRVVGGQSDLIVARLGRPIAGFPPLPSSLLNAGDVGADAEHPSQALIDVFAMQTLRGPVSALTVAICGDLRMRSVRSLVRLFERVPPRQLVMVTVDPLIDPATAAFERRDPWDVGDVDVLYVAGIPDGAVDEGARTTLRVTARALDALRPDGIVLSPMPVIDEIAHAVRADGRIRMFEQSDLGLPVRTALLELLLR